MSIYVTRYDIIWNLGGDCCSSVGHKKETLECGRTSCLAAERQVELRFSRKSETQVKVPIFRLKQNCTRRRCLLNEFVMTEEPEVMNSEMSSMDDFSC